MDISELNLMNEKHAERMLSVPREDDRRTEVFFPGGEEIVIFGITSRSYVFWISETRADDLETNRRIFAHIAQMERKYYLHRGQAVGLPKYGYDGMMHCYSAMLTSADEILPFQQKIGRSRQIHAPESPYFDLMQYNLLAPEDAVIPSYCPRTRDYRIRVYYANSDEIIIEGFADNNFIRWLSVTSIRNTELNRRIIDFLNETVAVEYSHFHLLIRHTEYTYDEAKAFYCAEVQSADEIIPHLEQAKARCRACEADGKFMQQLRSYQKKLAVIRSGPIENYQRKQALIERIRSYSFLRCSEDPAVRELYDTLIRMGSEQYNAYMTEAH